MFLHLDGSREVLGSRLEGRSGHFMPTTLLDSQLATLEPLDADEAAVVIDISAPVPSLVSDAVVRLQQTSLKTPTQATPGDAMSYTVDMRSRTVQFG